MTCPTGRCGKRGNVLKRVGMDVRKGNIRRAGKNLNLVGRSAVEDAKAIAAKRLSGAFSSNPR